MSVEEVGSCIITYLKEHPTSAKRLIAFSDSCGGQNRNILWLHIVNSNDYTYTVVATPIFQMIAILVGLRVQDAEGHACTFLKIGTTLLKMHEEPISFLYDE